MSQPATRPASVNYLVCATPRTGSYLLCDLLRRSGRAGNPTEYFSAGYQGYWMPRWGLTDYPAYLQRVFREAGAGGARGVKAHPRQFQYFLRQANGDVFPPPAEQRPILERWLPGCRYVWLRRRDSLRQALSWAKSMQTNIWWDASEAPAPFDEPKPKALRFDSAFFDQAIARMRAEDRMWGDYFAASGVTPLTVWYEDLAADKVGALASVLQHLGIDAPSEVGSVSFSKQSDAASERWRARYEALQPVRIENSLVSTMDVDAGGPDFVLATGLFEQPGAWDEARHSLLVTGRYDGPFKPDYRLSASADDGDPAAEIRFVPAAAAARGTRDVHVPPEWTAVDLAAHLGADRVGDLTGTAAPSERVRVLDLTMAREHHLDLDGFLQLPARPPHERRRRNGLMIAVEADAGDAGWAADLAGAIEALTGHRAHLVHDAAEVDHDVVITERTGDHVVNVGNDGGILLELRSGGSTRVAPWPVAWWTRGRRPIDRAETPTAIYLAGSIPVEIGRVLTDRLGVAVITDPARRADAHVVVDLGASGVTVESLWGASQGSVVINTLAATDKPPKWAADWIGRSPFRCADPRSLADVLAPLVRDRAYLLECGAATRDWFARRWNFTEQWDRYWAPALAPTKADRR